MGGADKKLTAEELDNVIKEALNSRTFEFTMPVSEITMARLAVAGIKPCNDEELRDSLARVLLNRSVGLIVHKIRVPYCCDEISFRVSLKLN